MFVRTEKKYDRNNKKTRQAIKYIYIDCRIKKKKQLTKVTTKFQIKPPPRAMRSAHVACQIKNEQKAKAAATAKPTPAATAAATTVEAEAAAAENGTRSIAAAVASKQSDAPQCCQLLLTKP